MVERGRRVQAREPKKAVGQKLVDLLRRMKDARIRIDAKIQLGETIVEGASVPNIRDKSEDRNEDHQSVKQMVRGERNAAIKLANVERRIGRFVRCPPYKSGDDEGEINKPDAAMNIDPEWARPFLWEYRRTRDPGVPRKTTNDQRRDDPVEGDSGRQRSVYRVNAGAMRRAAITFMQSSWISLPGFLCRDARLTGPQFCNLHKAFLRPVGSHVRAFAARSLFPRQEKATPTPILHSDLSAPLALLCLRSPENSASNYDRTLSLTHLRATLGEIDAAGLFKRERLLTGPQGGRIRVASPKAEREAVNLCANNYLGLADHPEVIAAAKAAMDEFGFGMASVRFICGAQTLHRELEQAIAKHLGKDDAIVFAACFDANGGVFEPLLDEADAIISDSLNHASIIDGVRLSKARRYRFANSDMNELEERLKEADAAGARFKLIATDGVFSMDDYVARLEGDFSSRRPLRRR